MNGAAGPGDDRCVDHFAVERNDAGALLLSFFNDGKNALGPGDFFRGRRKCLMDHADLARIDGKLSLEAEGTGVQSVQKEPFRIVGIGEGASMESMPAAAAALASMPRAKMSSRPSRVR